MKLLVRLAIQAVVVGICIVIFEKIKVLNDVNSIVLQRHINISTYLY